MEDLSKVKIDITMPAVIRPSLLERTLKSLVENVVDNQERFRLIINVDPIGENIKPAKVIKVARKYFSNIVYNISSDPSFAKAVIWVWTQSSADFILHFEDDWIITRKIDIDNMINIMNGYSELSSLRLFKHKTPKKNTMRIFNCIWTYNKDGFYVAKDWKKQLGLNPILFRKEFIDEALPRMKDYINPEKQFRYSQEYMRPIIKKWKYGIYTKPGERPLVIDTGRDWIKKTNFTKPKTGTFLTWETK
jgi:hypothetical protein